MTTFTVEQAVREYSVTPLESGTYVEDFYGSSGVLTDTSVERPDSSVLFFHRDPDGALQLVVIHDDPGDGSGGAVSFDLTLHGSATDARWLLMDDDNDFSGPADRSPDWTWNDRNKDGGALEGGFDGDFELTIEPAFNENAARNPLTPGRIDEWEVLSGGEMNDATDPIRKPLALDSSLTISSGDTGGSRVSASVTTLQFIPGENENISEGGYPLDGGLMEVFRENEVISAGKWIDVELPVDPVLDSWLKGDQTAVDGNVRPGNDELPLSLENARTKEPGKYADEFGDEPFGIFRFENSISISFDTPDGKTIDSDSVSIEFNETGKRPGDNRISLENRQNPISVTPASDVNGIPVEEWHGGFRERSNRKRRHYEYETDFEFDGIEGVRVLTISGGYAGFVADWAERVGNSPYGFFNTVWGWDVNETIAKLAWLAAPPQAQFLVDYLTVVPNTYSFIEFIVLADGRRYARVWDASQYPSLAMYVDGERKTLEKMPYRPRERFNRWLTVFHVQASAGITPYHTPLDYYGRLVNERDKELLRAIISDEVERVLNLLPVGWSVSDFVPRIPRETVGFHAEGTPVDDVDAPFDATAGLLFPWSGTIEPDE